MNNDEFRPGFNYKNSITITLSIIKAWEYQLKLQLKYNVLNTNCNYV